jgi:hypothetical protein
MTLVPFPAAPVPKSVRWDIDQPTQVNKSEFTSRRRVTVLAAAPRWTAKVTLPPIQGEDAILAWRAFAVDCDGRANSFRLIACERDQITGVAPAVLGAGQGGHSLVTSGWGNAGAKLRRGQFVTINDQLLMLMAPVVADAVGQATISFKPYIRLSPAHNAALVVTRPYALMSLTDDKAGWLADVGQEYAVSFDCEESF